MDPFARVLFYFDRATAATHCMKYSQICTSSAALNYTKIYTVCQNKTRLEENNFECTSASWCHKKPLLEYLIIPLAVTVLH